MKKIVNDTLDKLLEETDEPFVDIAEKAGCSRTVVYRRAKELEKEGRYNSERARRRKVDVNSLDHILINTDNPVADIAGRLGYSIATVGNRYKELRQQGVEVPKRRRKKYISKRNFPKYKRR